MRRGLIVIVATLGGVGAALIIALRMGPSATTPPQFLGYVEAETLLVGPEAGGRLITLAATEGEIVAAGAPLFALDAEAEQARVAEAEARLAKARAQLADLKAAQQRPEQIDVLQARRRQAEAELAFSRSEWERRQRLFERRAVAETRLQQAEMAFERDRAELAQIEREITVARLAARDEQIEAARAEVTAAEAALRQARTALAERRVVVPRDGRILDVFYHKGEVVTAGQPIVEILPPEIVRVRFYAPEPELAGIALGERISIACDGCPTDLAAEITFIASEAEFTPPVIFTREERAKLVFLIEARPLAPSETLKPGLPVEVKLTDTGDEE